MNKIKKIIGVIVVTMFLLALIPNLSYVKTALADPKCPGWDGYSAFCGYVGDPYEPCQIVAQCVPTCPFGCE